MGIIKKTMEQWEIELRAKLDKELIHGFYEIGTEPMIFGTGKQGKIEFEVLLQKALRGYEK